MNASSIINDEMTLEEKLAAIDAAVEAARQRAQAEAEARGEAAAPFDPAELTICEGCQ